MQQWTQYKNFKSHLMEHVVSDSLVLASLEFFHVLLWLCQLFV